VEELKMVQNTGEPIPATRVVIRPVPDPIYVTEIKAGRNLSATVSALVEVVKDLQLRIEKLEGR